MEDAVCWVKLSQAQDSRIAVLADEVTCNRRTQSCASRLRLQGYFSKRRSNVVRKTHIEKQLAIAAAAAVDLRCDSSHGGGGEGEPVWDKMRQRLYNR